MSIEDIQKLRQTYDFSAAGNPSQTFNNNNNNGGGSAWGMPLNLGIGTVDAGSSKSNYSSYYDFPKPGRNPYTFGNSGSWRPPINLEGGKTYPRTPQSNNYLNSPYNYIQDFLGTLPQEQGHGMPTGINVNSNASPQNVTPVPSNYPKPDGATNSPQGNNSKPKSRDEASDLKNAMDSLENPGGDSQGETTTSMTTAPPSKPQGPPPAKPEEPPAAKFTATEAAQAQADICTLLSGPQKGKGDILGSRDEYIHNPKHTVQPDQSYSKEDLKHLLDDTPHLSRENPFRTAVKNLVNGPVFDTLAGPDGKVSYDKMKEFSEKKVMDGMEDYKGIKIDLKSFSLEEAKRVEELLDAMDKDPDGQKLLTELGKHGSVINKDEAAAERLGAGAFASGNNITLGRAALGQDKAYTLEVLGHEMGHVVSHLNGGGGDTKNEEALNSTLGRRIRQRYEGKDVNYTDDGKTHTFKGGNQSEKESYDSGVASARVKKDNKDTTYSQLPENENIFGAFEKIGITFDWNHDPNKP